MDSNNEANKPIQTFIDFDKPRWPVQERFPLNLKTQAIAVQSVVYPDIEASTSRTV